MATEKAVITQSHLTDIANAIIAKGGAAGPLKPSEMKAAIEAIPTGGGGWTPPDEWRDANGNKIDLRKIADEHTPERYGLEPTIYTQRVAVLLAPATDGCVINGYAQFKMFADGNTTAISSNNPISSFGYHYIVVFGKEGESMYITTTNRNNIGGGFWVVGRSVLWVVGRGNAVLDCSFQRFLDNCIRLESVEDCTLMCPTNTTEQNGTSYCGLSNCRALKQLMNVKLNLYTKGANVNTGLFNNLYTIKELPMIDARAVEGGNIGLSATLYSLEKCLFVVLNKTSTATIQVYCQCNVSRESLAKFDDNMNIVDGIASFKTIDGLNMDVSGALGQRIYNIHATLQSKFTVDQWTAIIEAFNSHGWSVATFS